MKFENTKVMNFEGATRGTRNPLESWARSDSKYDENGEYIVGPNDLGLMQRLIKASVHDRSSSHDKFMRQITVCVDITAAEYFWLQFDTYKVGTVSNSTSKMHKLMSRPIVVEDFECEGMPGYRRTVEQVYPEIDEEKEVWKEYPLNPTYLISNYGRIYHKDFVANNGRLCKSKLLSNVKTQDGYLFVRLTINGESKQKRVHRLVAETFLEKPKDERKNEVNHINGNKLDNRVENLEWCSSSENQQHAVDTGLQPQNVTTYLGKFTVEERNKIKEEYNNTTISARQLAIKYDCSHTCIRSILHDDYEYLDMPNIYKEIFTPLVKILNDLRESYLNEKDPKKKEKIWRAVIQLLPLGYLQKRTVTLSYENIRSMYFQRRYHKLTEWSKSFVEWVKTLPYAEELIMYEGDDKNA